MLFIFQLVSPIDWIENQITRVKLPQRNMRHFFNLRGVLGGWGLTSEEDEDFVYASSLRKLNVVTMDKQTCTKDHDFRTARSDVLCSYAKDAGGCLVCIISAHYSKEICYCSLKYLR